MTATTPPQPICPRFTLELEFVLCLANPFYLQYLAGTYPHLLNPPTDLTEDSEAARFARYLAYLYAYWRTPTYSQYLTHPGAVLRNLELLQQEQFRKDLIRPDVIAKLFETENKTDGVDGIGRVDAAVEVQVEGEEGQVQTEMMDTAAG